MPRPDSVKLPLVDEVSIVPPLLHLSQVHDDFMVHWSTGLGWSRTTMYLDLQCSGEEWLAVLPLEDISPLEQNEN